MPKQSNVCRWNPKYQWCAGMERFLNREANRGRGLHLVRLTNTTTWNDFILGVNFVNINYPKGVLINYCPWCGARMGQRDEQGKLVEQEKVKNEI